MKKIIIGAVLLILISPAFSQYTDPSPTLTKQDYLKKSKHQKVAAWSLLGGGLVMGSIGTIVVLKEAVKTSVFPIRGVILPDQKKLNGGAALMLVGSAAILGSIPFFIVSSKNKKRAASLSLKNEPVPQIYQSSVVYRNIPSLTLKLQL